MPLHPRLRYLFGCAFQHYLSKRSFCSFPRYYECLLCYHLRIIYLKKCFLSRVKLFTFIFPVITKRSHNIVEHSTPCNTCNVWLNLWQVNTTPLVCETHNVTECHAILISFFQVILPAITQDNVLSYRKGFVRVFVV